MPREHDCEIVLGVVTDPSGAQQGLQQLESSAEDAARKAAKAAAQAAESTAEQTEKASTKVRQKSKETADKVSADAEKAGRKTQRSAEETKDKVVASFQAGQVAIGSLISAGVQRLTSALVGAGKQILQTGVEYNKQLETYRTGLINLLGDAQKADAALAAMQADAARTPFDTAALVQANQLLIGAGENAAYSRKTVLALGDAVSATCGGSAELLRMAQNLQQIKNVGKAASIDIKQFAMAGINIYQVLADYTGKSVQDVQEMTITYDVLTSALQAAAEEGGRYYNAMATQSQTLTGRLSTLKDNATQLAGALTEQLAAGLGVVVEKSNEVVIAMKNGWDTAGLDGLLQAVRTTAPELSGLANVVQLVKDNFALLSTGTVAVTTAVVSYKATTALATAATTAYSIATTALNAAHLAAASGAGALTVAQAALNSVMAANPIGAVVAVIATLTVGIATARATSETFAASWDRCMSGLKTAADFAVNHVLTAFNMLLSSIKGIAAAIAAMPNGAKAAVNAYNSTYSASRNEYMQTRTSKKWDDAHRDMEWDDDNGWIKKGTGSSSSGSGRKSSGGTVTSSVPASSGSSGKKGKTKNTGTETAIASTAHNTTTYSQNDLGTVTREVETLREKVMDASGQIKNRLTETTTETGKEMVAGIATTYTLVTKTVDGVTEKVTKSYADMSKVLTDTLKSTSTTYKNGATITTTDVNKIYADGSKHIETTATETGERIVDGVAETYTKVTKYIDGVVDSTEESCEKIDKSVHATRQRIEGYASEIQMQLSSGIFGIGKNLISSLKEQDWAQVSLQVTKLIWGEVDQEQREVIAKWAKKALTSVNDAYAGDGIKGMVSAVKNLLADGMTDSSGGQIEGIGKIIQELTGSGGMGQIIGTIVSKIGSIGQAVGSVAAKIGSLIAANPEVFAVLALVAGLAGLGAFLWKKHGKGKGGSSDGSADSANSIPSPAPAGSYTQSDTITAAELTRRTQAASAANQSRITGTQSGTGTAAVQQRGASFHSALTATFNVDGREMAQTTVQYFDEELGFRQ